jgi:hypothetical protein
MRDHAFRIAGNESRGVIDTGDAQTIAVDPDHLRGVGHPADSLWDTAVAPGRKARRSTLF